MSRRPPPAKLPLFEARDHADRALERWDPGITLEYHRDGDDLVRDVRTRVGGSRSRMDAMGGLGDAAPDKAWYVVRSRGRVPRYDGRPRGRLRTVDLFSGAGGLSLGASWAIRAIGRRPRPLLAVDIDPDAIDVHEYNHLPRKAWVGSVRDLFVPTDFLAAEDPRTIARERTYAPGAEWLRSLGDTDLLVGGPPCQGHSNLNNRTRRTDDRNQLYLWMALAARAFDAKAVIVENVASVKADAGDVVGRTLSLFDRLGYEVFFDEVLSADRLGVPQTRRRHFLIAVRRDVAAASAPAASAWLRERDVAEMMLLEAIGDLEDVTGTSWYDEPSFLSEENMRRIGHLFDADLHDLPDDHRPASHRDGHTYPSVYGRMYPDRPAGTLSTGFLTPGRGRYVHPTRRRTMTLHEGARVQGFPDDFRFVGASGAVPRRTDTARMIGDAVPPPMAFHVVLATLAMLEAGALDSE